MRTYVTPKPASYIWEAWHDVFSEKQHERLLRRVAAKKRH
jgi:hypothetical protein